jgi:hypothetical protein
MHIAFFQSLEFQLRHFSNHWKFQAGFDGGGICSKNIHAIFLHWIITDGELLSSHCRDFMLPISGSGARPLLSPFCPVIFQGLGKTRRPDLRRLEVASGPVEHT